MVMMPKNRTMGDQGDERNRTKKLTFEVLL